MCWNMSTITYFSPVASYMWHFPEPVHSKTRLLQLLKGINNIWKVLD
jgi:hypothetical protein